jgi:hypothetical protein
MKNIISKLLKELHQEDQKSRHEIVAKYGNSRSKAKNKIPFYIFQGEGQQREKIIHFLIKNNAFREKDDFYYAAFIIVSSGKIKDFILAYELIKKYREMDGKKPWGFHDKFFRIQKWKENRKEAEELVKKEIGIHPKKLDKLSK